MSKKIAISSARQLQHGQPSGYQDRGILCTPYMLSMGSSICRATRMPELATSACDRRHAYSSGQSETILWHEVVEDATAATSATNENQPHALTHLRWCSRWCCHRCCRRRWGKSRISRNSGVPGFPGCHSGAGKPEVRKSLPGRARPKPEPGLSLQISWMAAGGKTRENPKIRETVGSRRGFRHSTRRSHQPGRQRESGSNPDSDQPGGAQKYSWAKGARVRPPRR